MAWHESATHRVLGHCIFSDGAEVESELIGWDVLSKVVSEEYDI